MGWDPSKKQDSMQIGYKNDLHTPSKKKKLRFKRLQKEAEGDNLFGDN